MKIQIQIQNTNYLKIQRRNNCIIVKEVWITFYRIFAHDFSPKN